MTENWWDQSLLPRWNERFEKVELNPEDDYYKVFKIMGNVYAIFEPYNIQMVISYLIIGEKRAMLFDTGMGVTPIDRVVQQLTDKPVFVVLSHAHFDHVGGAHLFKEVWAVDTPFSRLHTAGFVNKYLKTYAPPESYWEGNLPTGFDPAAHTIEKYAVTHFLMNALRFDLGGRMLEVYFAPGHSPDSIVMLDRANRLLWTGDVFYVGQLYAFLEESDMPAYAATAEILGIFADQVDYLLPAHNMTMESPSWLPRMDSAFKALAADEDVPFTDTEEYREFLFDGISIMTKLPNK